MKIKSFFIILGLFTVLLPGCTSGSEENTEVEEVPEEKLTLEERAHRQATATLSIPRGEKYSLKIYKAHMNADNFEDAIVTVNRLEYAIDRASKSKNPSKLSELGYMGNYNHFFFYDGKLDKFSVPVVIPSSPKYELNIKFENIQSEAYKDLTLEYRIINASFRNFYVISGGTMQMAFQWKLFDYAGTDNPEANFIEYDKGTLTSAKDLLIYKGKIKDYSKDIGDYYTYKPEIEKTGELMYRFFYDPREMKYMTRSKPE